MRDAKPIVPIDVGTKQLAVAVPDSALSLLHAKGDVLRFWIDKANESELDKPKADRRDKLKRRGKVDDLRKRLALHFGYDLTAARSELEESIKRRPQAADAGPAEFRGGTLEVRRRQWQYLRVLAKEWDDACNAGCESEFHLNSEEPPPPLMSVQPQSNMDWHPIPAVRTAHALANRSAAATSTSTSAAPAAADTSFLTPAVRGGLEFLGALFQSMHTSESPSPTQVPPASHLRFPGPPWLQYREQPPPTPRTSHGWHSSPTRQDTPSTLAPDAFKPDVPAAESESHLRVSESFEFAPAATATTLFQLPVAPAGQFTSALSDSQSSPASATTSLSHSDSLPSSPGTPSPSHASTGGHIRVPSVASALRSCMATDSLSNLERADAGLRDVIRQMKHGEVQKIREAHGPKKGRPADPRWQSVKNTVTRHESIWDQLQSEFGGDEEKFFAFFVIPEEALSARRKRKQMLASEGDLPLRPYRLVAGAVYHMRKDIQEEKRHTRYSGPSASTSFSLERWQERWGTLNNWEIWRALGKERYGGGSGSAN
ncbi:hypothetical protein EUX98_g9414 [Antrodiella citrinella]|uniref:Uncharacterized protein n=1 Tax=Antrodiella citrinella TaxID=2447956 RepID=A0A4S4LZA1_9APHY|nr:hypothetical protein EUX98_g9414 [Antrodiella citrinella]